MDSLIAFIAGQHMPSGERTLPLKFSCAYSRSQAPKSYGNSLAPMESRANDNHMDIDSSLNEG